MQSKRQDLSKGSTKRCTAWKFTKRGLLKCRVCDAAKVSSMRRSTDSAVLLLFLVDALANHGAAPPAATVSEWRSQRRQTDAASFLGCCPGRWCCRDGKRCCPPRALPNQTPAAPMPVPFLDEYSVEGQGSTKRLALLVEEALSGLLSSCEPLDVPGHSNSSLGWESVRLAAAANFRDAGEQACRTAQSEIVSQITNEQEQCIRLFVGMAVEAAFAPLRSRSGRRVVYLSGATDTACTPYRRGVRRDVGRCACGEYGSGIMRIHARTDSLRWQC